MAGTASVAGEVFVDALPYFDQGYDAAGVREAVSKIIFRKLAVIKPCLFQTAVAQTKTKYSVIQCLLFNRGIDVKLHILL